MKDRRPSRAVALYYTYTSRLLRLRVRKETHLLGRFRCLLLLTSAGQEVHNYYQGMFLLGNIVVRAKYGQ